RPMLLFALIVAALLAAGTCLATFFWRDDDVTTLERVTAGAVLGAAIWIGASWIFALTHTLTRTSLWVLAGIVLAAGVACVTRLPRIRVTARALILLLPVVLWSLFALWRGAVLPPASHDALAYHLPRAVFIARAGGFEHFPAADTRLNAYPANYELLLADVILMSGTDDLTEWLSTAMFALFLLGSAALARRWWRGTSAIPEVVIATATTPILLLHSSAHKNDVMAAAFAVTALLWGARWCARGGRMPMLLLVVSLVLGGGTKPQVAGVMLGLAPFLLARVIRERIGIRPILVTGVLALAFFAIGGAAPYAMLLMQNGGGGASSQSPFAWGDLENLWQVPILLWLAPFSPNPLGVWVPWRGEYWFWPRYEVFFSHWGVLFSVLVLLIPFGIYAARRDPNRERFTGTMAALVAMAVLLPAEIRPVGFFAALARYLLFIVPVVLVHVVPPLVDALRRSTRFRALPHFFAALLVAVFAHQAIDYAISDAFTPVAYMRLARAYPGTRQIWFAQTRAGSVVDRLAGPDDVVAVGGSFDTWIHPAFGAKLTREVILLPSNATAADVPARAQWVIVDRSWNALWGNPNLTDMGKFWQYAGHGRATDEDLQLYRQLAADPRFRLVWRDARVNQAVFWRLGSTRGREPEEWRGER
ncbi:MAG TPA: hypothetical protein VHK90_12520, partial [Thermoanaerobaculia bacterium]|nr:hypothetical protein [Thermoanaerobaculia bacterium]